mgnify:CR=1 FL=1|jgi:hypothetical protein
MEDYTLIFRKKLSGQVELCARKILEGLQKDLQGPSKLQPTEIYQLALAANLLLLMRDRYGEKRE